ncbi:MAG: bifunctional diguanylate cyclase/phosphodiesterase [Spirochaetaceae bacterium]|nr:bifunctional diguanylate cyclase/phosphodiesterase [Spirochaetaceae bacterium]
MDVNLVDYLTGLPNIEHFLTLASAKKKSMVKSQKLPVLLFMDLNGMKNFNHKFGFEAGNALLQSFAQILITFFGIESCCRISGDHFAAITEEEGLEDVLKKLMAESNSLGQNNKQSQTISVHIGIYLFKTEDVAINIACDRANTACEPIKNIKESAFSYYDISILEKNEKKQYIIDNLDRALKEKWITVYYQPIVRAANNRVCDEEALARWIDPEKGFLSPAEFIPILEETKLIYKVDLYILEQVLEKMKLMRQEGFYEISQSINISRSDFDVCDIVKEICTRVDNAEIAHDKINIEITESIIGGDFEFMTAQIERFKRRGFSVWMDDFGSGYSSLNTLQLISFDLIKFDMSFMRQLDKGKNGKIILTELMRMAASLGVDTVCEGVETEEQVRFLQEIGCSKLQGFYFCKPIPVESILEKYRTGKQIGFENPAEARYSEIIGRVNLHDLSVINNNEKGFNNFFNTIPMAILETDDAIVRYVRTNQSYRDFMLRYFSIMVHNEDLSTRAILQGEGASFYSIVKQAAQDNKRLFSDEKLPDGSRAYYYASKLSEDPVNKKSAVVVAVLSITDAVQGETYVGIARALARDYSSLYYVNLETEEFIEYSSKVDEEELATERHGTNFFAQSRRDAITHIYEEDRDYFIRNFTKENITKAINENGTFMLSYRLLQNGVPVYVSMKAMPMQKNKRHIIIGVSNVDTQMKQKMQLEQAKQDQLVYSRIMALSGDYLCIYMVNLSDDSFVEYLASSEFKTVGIQEKGENYFATSLINADWAVVEEDREVFKKRHTKENILKTLEKDGVFTSRHRILINGEPVMVLERGVHIKENGEDRLIFGTRRP